MKTKELFAFAQERYIIYLHRQQGKTKPWTRNPILQNYRFSNAYRELDKTTVWIANNWRDPHDRDMNCWFAMAVARYINWPDTLQAIGYPDPWSRVRVMSKMLKLQEDGKQVFGGAYFLNSIGPKIQSIVNDRLDVLWNHRADINRVILQAQSLAELYSIFIQQFGLGSFMVGQVIADLKYTPPFREQRMHDWWTWATSGPGSKRGLNRVMDRDVNATWTEAGWLECLTERRNMLLPLVKRAKMPVPHAQDVQNWLCEFDKYERVRLGEGRPKQKFNGGK